MNENNQNSSENHKKWVREVFDRTASSYGKGGCSYFDTFGKELVLKAKLQPGENVLDIATGCGAILFKAAEIVGDKTLIIGIDISPEMIRESKKQCPFSWVKLLTMDVENMSLEDQMT